MNKTDNALLDTIPWWKKATAYQIYPRSFYDTNNDGIGDLQGIIQKLDYLAELGIDLLWICPFYPSPNDDNGYDISDYQGVHPDFGTLGDLDELIKKAHRKGIRIILDLVINHTSDEHPWFIESRSSRDNPKRDWYIWRDGAEQTPEKPTQDPNNWESIFHGSAWEFDERTNQYYLHLFSKKQPDLNWQNPEVKEALFSMIHWWLERGIDGFRVDAISHIQKKEDLPSLPNPQGEKYVSSFAYHMNVPGIETHLKDLKEKAFSPYDLVTVGEANGVSADEALPWVAEQDEGGNAGIFNMIFQFEHMALWAEDGNTACFDLVEFKQILTRWQNQLEGKGWNALYLENHDQARSINRFGNPRYWFESATALATCYFLMKGTPFIYQGQEIGMPNADFASLADFDDISAKNLISKLQAKGYLEKDILNSLNQISRDHSRIPMRWDNSHYAGFSSVTPWFDAPFPYPHINVLAQQEDPQSVWHFYKKLIELRKTNASLLLGRYALLLDADPNVYAYQRISDEATWTIITNLSEKTVECDLVTQPLGKLMLTNCQEAESLLAMHKLTPYCAFVFCLTH